MNKKRPINLALTTFKFPPMAIASILHRISGVILFFFIPILLYMLDKSLQSPTHFDTLKECLTSSFVKFVLWLMLTGLIYHLIAGIRHMIMDMGFGESLNVGRKSAYSIMIITAVMSVIIGIWLW